MSTTTVWQVARRPRWIWMLVLALAVAAGFAALGQWQIGRAVATGAPLVDVDTETARPLDEVTAPATTATEKVNGHLVTVTAASVPGDTLVIGSRLNGGALGYWVVAHTRTVPTAGSSIPSADLPVALGWAADPDAAAAAAADFDARGVVDLDLAGRFVMSEGPVVPADGQDPRAVTMVSTAAFVNVWSELQPDAYEGYLIADQPLDGLAAIDSASPERDVSLNWLNVFYAVEWVVFAGFALYLWYRLVKDTWERELEEAADAAAAARADDGADALT